MCDWDPILFKTGMWSFWVGYYDFVSKLKKIEMAHKFRDYGPMLLRAFETVYYDYIVSQKCKIAAPTHMVEKLSDPFGKIQYGRLGEPREFSKFSTNFFSL